RNHRHQGIHELGVLHAPLPGLAPAHRSAQYCNHMLRTQMFSQQAFRFDNVFEVVMWKPHPQVVAWARRLASPNRVWGDDVVFIAVEGPAWPEKRMNFGAHGIGMTPVDPRA